MKVADFRRATLKHLSKYILQHIVIKKYSLNLPTGRNLGVIPPNNLGICQQLFQLPQIITAQYNYY